MNMFLNYDGNAWWLTRLKKEWKVKDLSTIEGVLGQHCYCKKTRIVNDAFILNIGLLW